MTDLRNNVAFVTGAGSGVGRAVSLGLASLGVVTALCGRRPEPLDSVAAEIQAAGGRAIVLPVDIADEEAVEAAFDQLIQAAGGVDLLINCAGVGIYGNVEQYSLDDWRETLETNVTGLFLCSRAALPSMRERGGGHIAAISSGAGRRGYANLAGVLSLEIRCDWVHGESRGGGRRRRHQVHHHPAGEHPDRFWTA